MKSCSFEFEMIHIMRKWNAVRLLQFDFYSVNFVYCNKMKI